MTVSFSTSPFAPLGSLITLAVSVALIIAMHQLVPGAAAYLLELIHLPAGAALLIASEFMMKPTN